MTVKHFSFAHMSLPQFSFNVRIDLSRLNISTCLGTLGSPASPWHHHEKSHFPVLCHVTHQKSFRSDMSLPQFFLHFAIETARFSMASYLETVKSAASSSHLHRKSHFPTTLAHLIGLSASLFDSLAYEHTPIFFPSENHSKVAHNDTIYGRNFIPARSLGDR